MLFNYGFPEDGNFSPDDADANLVPALVEKVALPVLHHEISHCWDMLSMQETKNAVSATSLIIDYVPASSEALAELLVTIRTRLSDAIADIMVFGCFNSLYPSIFICVCSHLQNASMPVCVCHIHVYLHMLTDTVLVIVLL